MIRYENLLGKKLAIDHDHSEVKHEFVNDHMSMMFYSSNELK
jgi:hypothetical protein